MLRRLSLLLLCLSATLAAGQQVAPVNTTPGCADPSALPRSATDDSADKKEKKGFKQRVKDQFSGGCAHVFLTSCWGKQDEKPPDSAPIPGVPESKDQAKDKPAPPAQAPSAGQQQPASTPPAPPAKPSGGKPDLTFPEQQSRQAQDAAQGKTQKSVSPDLQFPEEQSRRAQDAAEGRSSSSQSSSSSSSSRDGHNPALDKPAEGEMEVIEMRPYNPHKAEKDVEVGDFYYKRSNYKGAISRYREALELRPAYPLATFKLADALEKDKQLEDAAIYYSEYVRQFPDGPQLAAARQALARLAPQIRADAAHLKQAEVDHDLRTGESLLAQKNYPAAVQRFCDVAGVAPDNARAIYRLAQAQQAIGDFAAASENYQTYLKLAPNGAFAPAARREIERLAPQLQQGKITSPSSEIRP